MYAIRCRDKIGDEAVRITRTNKPYHYMVKVPADFESLELHEQLKFLNKNKYKEPAYDLTSLRASIVSRYDKMAQDDQELSWAEILSKPEAKEALREIAQRFSGTTKHPFQRDVF